MAVAQALLRYITTGDYHLMRKVNSWRPPRWVRLWMICATRGGDGWLWYAMLFVVLLFGDDQKWRAVGSALLAAGSGIGLFLWLKRATGRKRPCAIATHCWATLLPPDQFSFPSGHTITAFAILLSVGWFYPGLQVGLGFCAVSIAASRILLGMHFLSDVVAGALLGALVGYCSVLVVG